MKWREQPKSLTKLRLHPLNKNFKQKRRIGNQVENGFEKGDFYYVQ